MREVGKPKVLPEGVINSDKCFVYPSVSHLLNSSPDKGRLPAVTDSVRLLQGEFFNITV